MLLRVALVQRRARDMAGGFAGSGEIGGRESSGEKRVGGRARGRRRREGELGNTVWGARPGEAAGACAVDEIRLLCMTCGPRTINLGKPVTFGFFLLITV